MTCSATAPSAASVGATRPGASSAGSRLPWRRSKRRCTVSRSPPRAGRPPPRHPPQLRQRSGRLGQARPRQEADYPGAGRRGVARYQGARRGAGGRRGGSKGRPPAGERRRAGGCGGGEAARVSERRAEGREVDVAGAKVRIPWVRDGKLDVWMAGYGPKALNLVGRKADGFILQLAAPVLLAGAMQHVPD